LGSRSVGAWLQHSHRQGGKGAIELAESVEDAAKRAAIFIFCKDSISRSKHDRSVATNIYG